MAELDPDLIEKARDRRFWAVPKKPATVGGLFAIVLIGWLLYAAAIGGLGLVTKDTRDTVNQVFAEKSQCPRENPDPQKCAALLVRQVRSADAETRALIARLLLAQRPTGGVTSPSTTTTSRPTPGTSTSKRKPKPSSGADAPVPAPPGQAASTPSAPAPSSTPDPDPPVISADGLCLGVVSIGDC